MPNSNSPPSKYLGSLEVLPDLVRIGIGIPGFGDWAGDRVVLGICDGHKFCWNEFGGLLRGNLCCVLGSLETASEQPSSPSSRGSLWKMFCSFVLSMSLLFLLQIVPCSVPRLYDLGWFGCLLGDNSLAGFHWFSALTLMVSSCCSGFRCFVFWSK